MFSLAESIVYSLSCTRSHLFCIVKYPHKKISMIHHIVVAFFITGGVCFLRNYNAVCRFLNQTFQPFLTLLWPFRVMANKDIIRLLARLEQRADSDVMDSTTRHSHGDRKALAKEQAKKIAMGHKANNHEEGQKMS